MNTEFVKAIKDGDINKCTQMLNANPELVNSVATRSSFGENGLSVLMLAISLYKNDISKLLIEKGANVSYESETSGNIPLHTAVIYSNEDMIKYLLTYMNEHNLNTNIENNEGKTPIEIYVENKSKNNPGFFAAMIGLKNLDINSDVILSISDDFKDYKGTDDDESDDEYGGGKKIRSSSRRRRSNKRRKTNKRGRKSNKKGRNYRK
jgi:hypothetical protein